MGGGTGLGLFLTAVFLAWAVPLWLIGFMRGRGAFDQVYFHIKAIQRFIGQWPAPDFSRYESATAPGYHVVMAAAGRWIGAHPTVLQIAASAFTAGVLLTAAAILAAAARRAGVSMLAACAAALPIACSMYVVFPGVWLQPDNAGWLGVLTILMLAINARASSILWMFAAAAVLAALVFTRQSHLWATGIFWAAAWLSAAPIADSSLRSLFSDSLKRTARAALAVALSLPAFAIVSWLFKLWDGMVPPDFRDQHNSGANLATPAFILALVGVFSMFFIAWLAPHLRTLWRESKPLVFLAAFAGALVAALPVTTFLNEPRSSGLWNLMKLEERFGLIIAGHTSPSLVILSALGAVCLVGWLRGLEGSRRWLLLATFCGFVAAQTANSNCWQRYIEPFLLVLIPLMALEGSRRSPIDAASRTYSAPSRWMPALRIVGPVALAAMLCAVMLHALITAEPLKLVSDLPGSQQRRTPILLDRPAP